MCRVGFGELHAEVWEFGVERAWWDITGRDWVTVPQIPLNEGERLMDRSPAPKR